MLTQQFFTRVQLTKILDFKSDGSIKYLEKKGFLIPQIKPSKYSFNQVLFMMICKEITDFADFSWKYLIEVKLNCILEKNLIDCDILSVYFSKKKKEICVTSINDDDNRIRNMYDNLNDGILRIISKLKQSEDNLHKIRPSFYVCQDKNGIYLLFPVDKIYRKLQNQCTELKIDLKEKIVA